MLATLFSNMQVLIADPSMASRASFIKILTQLGVNENNISIADDFIMASVLIKKHEPKLIISEYELDGGSGLDLSELTALYKNPKEKIFLLVTVNSAQTLVAQAAEGDVDCFFIKPFAANHIERVILESVKAKIEPNPYLKKIDLALEHATAKKLDLAIQTLNEAIPLHSKPALALAYRGSFEFLKRLVQEPEKSYLEGLGYNEIHYRCLVGLLEFLQSQSRWDDSYSVVKRISNIFPLNTKRLPVLLTLAIKTGNIDDIQQYYESFLTLGNKDEIVVKYICAGMVICAKHFFKIKENERAFKLLWNAAHGAAGNPSILREIVLSYMDHGKIAEADQVLELFPISTRKGNDYWTAQTAVQGVGEMSSAYIDYLKVKVDKKGTSKK